ncbi:MAG: hypothetical protein ABI583_07455 [Betaproteobacteria bacterium]
MSHKFSSLIIAAALLCGASAKAQVPKGLNEAIQVFARGEKVEGYSYSMADLNNDGKQEALVLMSGDWCGSGGCSLAIFKATDRGFKFLSSSTISQEPISVLKEVRYGWQTLVVSTNFDARQVHALMRYNGARYPLNPSIEKLAGKSEMKGSFKLIFTSVNGRNVE